jgi:hypothetical protein
MRQHPDVLERREQLRHVLGVPSFSIMSSDSLSRTEIPESIEEDVIIRLIDQYLREFGFDRASAVLRQETGAFVASNPAIMMEALQDGDLQNLIRLGVTRAMFDDPTSNDPDPELEAIIEGANLAEQDVNIWNEPSTIASSSSMLQANYLNPAASSGNSTRNLILEKLHSGASAEDDGEGSSGRTHTVKAATFNQLVLWLLSSESDSHFRHTFFATLMGFTTPQQFIAKVEQRYSTPPGLPKLDQVELFSIANTMTHWVSSHGHEFSTRVYTLLNKFVENTFSRDGHHHIAESLQGVIAKAYFNRNNRNTPPILRSQPIVSTHEPPHATPLMTGSSLPGSAPLASILASSSVASGSPTSHSLLLNSVGEIRRSAAGFPEPKLPKNVFELSLSLDDVDEEEIARQITTLDSETFHMMKSKELLKNAWLKNRGKKAKRVVLLLNAANALSKWVIDSISVATTNPKMAGATPASSPSSSSFHPSTSSSTVHQGSTSPMSGGGVGGGLSSSSGSILSPSSTVGAGPILSGGAMGGINVVAGGSSVAGGMGSAGMEKSSSASSLNGKPTLSPHGGHQQQTLSNQLTPANMKKVVKTITRWLKIAEHLRNLNNFHSLLAIWVALRSRQVSLIFELLKKEFSKNALDTLALLDHLFSNEDSYAAYRNVMIDITHQPTIPALSIQLRDLALIEEVQPDFVRSSKTLINFRKRRTLYISMKDILRHQQTRHNLLQVYQVSDRIQAALITAFEALQIDKPGGHYDYMSW